MSGPPWTAVNDSGTCWSSRTSLLLCIVAPIGFLLSALLAWRAGDVGAFVKACALVICFILLWLGVGSVLSIALPSRVANRFANAADGGKPLSSS